MNGKLAVAGTYDGRCIFYETEVRGVCFWLHVVKTFNLGDIRASLWLIQFCFECFGGYFLEYICLNGELLDWLYPLLLHGHWDWCTTMFIQVNWYFVISIKYQLWLQFYFSPLPPSLSATHSSLLSISNTIHRFRYVQGTERTRAARSAVWSPFPGKTSFLWPLMTLEFGYTT